jgi:hypothetical protein
MLGLLRDAGSSIIFSIGLGIAVCVFTAICIAAWSVFAGCV